MIPSRRLVGLYITTAHVSLALAFALVAWNPYAVGGFFYHARIVGIVHLITIGWIAMSILGNLYVVLPMACGVPFRARRADYAAYSLVVIGLIGMVAHFWIAEFGGMAWSAGTAAAGIAYVMVRLASTVRRAKIPGGVKLHLYFASANMLVAAGFGVVLGFDKVRHFLPGYVLSNVFAHAHLAALGWASMMAVGLSYRLLPMIIPSASPSSPSIYVSAILLEIGVAGLFVSLLTRSALTMVWALVIAMGFAACGAHVVWMLARTRRAKPARPNQDSTVAHIAAAGGWLLIATICGVLLTALPVSEATLRLAAAYGVFGLVGFLAQIIIGFERLVMPTVIAYWAIDRTGRAASPRPGQSGRHWAVYYSWLAGVPLLAYGFFFNAALILASGAAALSAAALLMMADTVALWKRNGTSFAT